MANSLWKLPEVQDVKVPILLMREQASELARLTGGLLRAHVNTQKLGDELYLGFAIRVPTLDDYTVELFTYEQPMQIYPGVLESRLHNQRIQISDYETFTAALQHMLSSDETQKVLSALLAQAKTG